MENPEQTLTLTPDALEGAIQRQDLEAPIADATWYTAQKAGDQLSYRFPPGTLAAYAYLTTDLLLDGNQMATFVLVLREGEDGPRFGYGFGLLNQCSARLRMPLSAVDQNRWRFPREGALLKPLCRYERVDLQRVDRIEIAIVHKGPKPVRWCMTPVVATHQEPPLLDELVLPKGALLDELGQSTLHEWSAKSRSHKEVTERLQAQLQAAPNQRWPQAFSRWGGWSERRVEATGFFRTHHDGQRWWLIDPEGHLFWSSGIDCVRVDAAGAHTGLETALAWLPDPEGEYADAYEVLFDTPGLSYLAANLIRAFGVERWYEKWAETALGEIRRIGFNTVANRSDYPIARQAAFPYTRYLMGQYLPMAKVYQDLPDVFSPEFPAVADAYAETLRDTADDPAMIGYFMMNEPTWGFAQETPAAGMLFNTPSCHSRRALAGYLRDRYADDAALSSAWGIQTTLDAVAGGPWNTPLTEAAQADLEAFSEIMVGKFFGELNRACREADPNHLNLGVRYYRVPPRWARKGMRCFDVFSMNCYKPRLPADDMSQIAEMLDMPIVIGEFHFGALDVGLPASGIGHVPDQESRGKAYRIYVEDAAAKPWCVGAHYFVLYDQSAIGRFDGEAYQIGFLDTCHRPYEPLVSAARASHERLYRVAAGEVSPYDDEPEYLPLLYL